MQVHVLCRLRDVAEPAIMSNEDRDFVLSELLGEAKESSQGDKEDKKERSTIEFPYNALDKALEVAAALYSRVGHSSCEQDELAAQLNMSIGGAFRTKTAAAKVFGLVDKDGRSAFRLTDLGIRLASEPTNKADLVEAFLAVPLYRAVYERFKGNKLPPSKALEREMAELGVSHKQTDRARQAFEKSAELAGFFESGNDRLVRPNLNAFSPGDRVQPQAIDHSSDADEEVKRIEKKRVEPKSTIDPIIQGLIERLPASGSKWEKRERDLWLQILSNTFDLVYQE